MIVAHQWLAGHLLTTGLLVAGAAAFAWLWARRPSSTIRPLVWWGSGTVAVVVASVPWLERAAATSLTWHMAQHLVLWIIAAPLLAAAHPIRVVARAGVARTLSRRARRLVDAVRIGPARIGPRLTMVWLATVVTLYGTHLSPVYDLALQHQWLHEVEHGAYLGSSVLLWGSILGPSRSPAIGRVGLAVATLSPVVFLGMILTSADSVLYETYRNQLGPTGGLADQRAGAALMWLGTMAVLVPLTIVSVFRWATTEHDAAVRREQLLDPVATMARES